MELSEAKQLAEKYLSILKPFCERIEIAGSIRREKPFPNDIELVCIRKGKELFNFVEAVEQWKKVRGKASGKYTQRVTEEGIKLDIFMADKNNWGLIFAIRTGSARFSHKELASRWVAAGYKSVNGRLMKGSQAIPIPEEKDLFNLLNLKYVEPKDRE